MERKTADQFPHILLVSLDPPKKTGNVNVAPSNKLYCESGVCLLAAPVELYGMWDKEAVRGHEIWRNPTPVISSVPKISCSLSLL